LALERDEIVVPTHVDAHSSVFALGDERHPLSRRFHPVESVRPQAPAKLLHTRRACSHPCFPSRLVNLANLSHVTLLRFSQ
jgi:hypothetical protein